MTNLKRYTIAEESFGGSLAIVATILGITGLTAISKRKATAKNKMKRTELEQWLTKNGVGTSDAAISAFVDKKMAEIAHEAATLIQKVYSSTKFRYQFDAVVKATVGNIHSRCDRDDNRDYFEDTLKWSVYTPGCMKLGTEVWKNPRHPSYDVAMIDPKSKLYNDIMDNEDQDDNAPEYLREILGPTIDDVGKGVIAKLSETYADVLASGLIKIEYHDCWESYYDLLPEIYIAAANVPSKDGKHRNVLK